jgi:hypothetical protein
MQQPDEPVTFSTEFLRAVNFMRALHPRERDLALYAANWWTDEELNAHCGVVPEPKPKPKLEVVR